MPNLSTAIGRVDHRAARDFVLTFHVPGPTVFVRGRYCATRAVRKGSILIVVATGMVSLAGSDRPQAAVPPQTPPSPTALAAPRHSATIKQYCVTCHNERVKSGGLVLATLDPGHVASDTDAWEKVVRKLRVGAMPPPGAPRPDEATYHGLTTWLEAELDHAATVRPNAGRPLLHRLNRTEYANAIRDLLALDVGDVAALLPPDDSAYGFDNVADALGFSSLLTERYVTAAGRLAALAVGDPDLVVGSETYSVRQDLSQDQHVDGQPFGTIGGMIVRHTFPVDGEYMLSATLMRTNVDQPRGLEYPYQLEFTIDGERAFVTPVGGETPGGLGGEGAKGADAIDGKLRVRLPVEAGPHDVGVAFIQRSLVQNTRKLQPYRSSFDTYDATGLPHIKTLAVTGPYSVSGPGDTPSRRRVFVCRPSGSADEKRCATQIVRTLARRAYRQPVGDSDLKVLMAFYRGGRRTGTFEMGVQRALQRILASPQFILRIERDPADALPGTPYRLNDFALASRLSFFLWSSIPDDELLDVAGRGRLKTPAEIDRQVRRMLADPRSAAFVTNFAGQWLQLRNLKNSVPDTDLFPEFDDNLRQAFRRESELLFDSIVRENRDVRELLTADYTFVNERLARHYKIPNVAGSRFRRVPVTDEARKGLLGHGSILTLTSNADRTSPVVRGKWILTNMLGMAPSPPPANVPPLKDNRDRDRPLTMRDQMEEHRRNPVCASCHKLMDPLGFMMENFDAVGAWRTVDAGTPIDASGQFIDGARIDGVVGLRGALLQHPEVFVGTLVEKLLTYGVGRGLESYDMPAVRKIVGDAARHNYRFSSIILGVVGSVPFQMRMKGTEIE
jgi:hypothetical protein